MGLSFAMTMVPAAMAETFSIDGMALNTNSNFPRKDGHPIMSTWRLNPNDNDQQFDRQGQSLRHRSTGKCLNAYQPSVGSIVNVYPCNGNDGDQKFAILSAGGNVNLIQKIGTNLCLDMDSRNQNTRMKLWNCSANFPNQRFVSNASIKIEILSDYILPFQAGYKARLDQALGAKTVSGTGNTHVPTPLAIDLTVLASEYRASNGLWYSAAQARAIAAGQVIQASYQGVYGNTVVIRHDDGSTSQYSHLHNYAVQNGQRVSAGQNLGVIGMTASNARANQNNVHLHFEMKDRNGKYITFQFKDANGVNFYQPGIEVTAQNP